MKKLITLTIALAFFAVCNTAFAQDNAVQSAPAEKVTAKSETVAPAKKACCAKSGGEKSCAGKAGASASASNSAQATEKSESVKVCCKPGKEKTCCADAREKKDEKQPTQSDAAALKKG